MTRLPTPKPGILDIAAYVPGKSRAPGDGPVVKVSANENPLGCSPSAREAYRREIDRLNRYPDSSAAGLREAVAQHFGLAPGRLFFGCGSDELFTLVCQAYLAPGDNVVQPAHGFAAWAIAARATGGEVRSAPEDGLRVDVDAVLARVDERTRIVFVANPANPTGTWLIEAEIARLDARLPSGVVLVLDEAYAEYGEAADGYRSGLKRAERSARIFVTRTFSKAYGLAGLRVGWGYAPEAMAAAMERIRPPFNVSGPALAAAVAALGDRPFLARSLAYVERYRPVLMGERSRLGLEAIASATNFVTFAVPRSSGWTAVALERALTERRILVRGLAGYGLPDHLRATIGAEGENGALLGALADLLRPRQSGELAQSPEAGRHDIRALP